MKINKLKTLDKFRRSVGCKGKKRCVCCTGYDEEGRCKDCKIINYEFTEDFK